MGRMMRLRYAVWFWWLDVRSEIRFRWWLVGYRVESFTLYWWEVVRAPVVAPFVNRQQRLCQHSETYTAHSNNEHTGQRWELTLCSSCAKRLGKVERRGSPWAA